MLLLRVLLKSFEMLIFCPKNQHWFPEKIVDFFRWKTCENVVVLDFLAVDNFDFTRKIVKKVLGEKLLKMLGLYQNWIFGQKFDFLNSALDDKSWMMIYRVVSLSLQGLRRRSTFNKNKLSGSKKFQSSFASRRSSSRAYFPILKRERRHKMTCCATDHYNQAYRKLD